MPLRILILNTFPTFETKYLKNFLEAKGNSILLRSQLSRGLYKFEYINRDPDPVYELTRELLEEFDLVITDYQAYRRLSPGSRSALEESIAQDGTGLLIQPDDSFFRRSEQDGYFVFESDNLLQLNASKPELVVEKYPYTFANSFPVQPIPLDHYVPAAERPLGNGRVVTTVLRNTYRWLLKGEEAYYEKFWSLLLRRAAARQTPTATWEARTHLPRRDAPFEFRLHTAIPKPEVINQRGARIPMAEDVLVEGVWNGREYPGRTGWNHLRLKGDSLADFPYYVYGEGSWSTRESFATRQANRRQFGRNQLKAERQQAYLPIRPAWFYISFLLSMAWLWLEPRLFGD